MENHKTTDPKELEKKTQPYPMSIGMDPNAAALIRPPRPDLNGRRIQDPGDTNHGPGAIYMIDEGMKRWIPNPGTYENLFCNWSGIEVNHQLAIEIPEGPAFPDGACLVNPAFYPPVYLIDGNRKRLVTGKPAMDKYYFDYARVYRMIPPILVQYLPDGKDIT